MARQYKRNPSGANVVQTQLYHGNIPLWKKWCCSNTRFGLNVTETRKITLIISRNKHSTELISFLFQRDRWMRNKHSYTHSSCSGGAENCQIIVYIKSPKKEKLTKKINTLLNNLLLLPKCLCGPAGWRSYLHLFPFKTFFPSPSLCSAPLHLLMR